MSFERRSEHWLRRSWWSSAREVRRAVRVRGHLTEEVAYRSELAERRACIHCAVASAPERLYPDRLDELAELIAHHLEEAERLSLASR